jgi:hypothetical protein
MTDLKIGDVVRTTYETVPGGHTHIRITDHDTLARAKSGIAWGRWVKVEPQEHKQEPKQ